MSETFTTLQFDDGKAPDALRTIGEVAKALGIRQHVLRYWEEQFPMLRPLTRAGGRRYYRAEDVALVAEIDRLLHHEGYTIRGARQALGSKGGGKGKTKAAVEPAAPVVAPAAEAVPTPSRTDLDDDLLAALTVLRGHLQGMRDRLAKALAA